MKVFITGAYGMLGKDVLAELDKDRSFTPYPIELRKSPILSHKNEIILDITEKAAYMKTFDRIRPDAVVHCAAITDVKWCGESEANKKVAYKLHVDATREISSHGNIKFIYISTDSVFNGKKGAYKEGDPTDPVNYYALTKLEGEKTALEANKKTLSLRTNIYGFHLPMGKSLFEWAYSNLSKGIAIDGFDDLFFNAIYTKQLALIIKTLLKSDISGIINVASKEKISKYEFLIKIADVFGFDRKLVMKKHDNLIPPRPKNTTLNIDKLKKLFGVQPSIDDGLNMLKKDLVNSGLIK